MKIKTTVSITLVALLILVTTLTLLIAPVSAIYQNVLPCDADGDNELTENEVSSAICSYMLGRGNNTLDDVGDAAYIYEFWNKEPLTITDHYKSRAVTLYRPVERIALASTPSARTIASLNAADKVVGVYRNIKTDDNQIVTKAYPELRNKTDLSEGSGANAEAVIGIEPDVVFYSASADAAILQDHIGIPVVALMATYGIDFSDPAGAYNVWKLAGQVVGEEERAQQLINYSQSKVNALLAISSTIGPDDQLVAYVAAGGDSAITSCAPTYYALDIAGGINPAAGLPSSWGSAQVSKEQIVVWNPDVIFIRFYRMEQALTKDVVMNDPSLATVSATNESKVYYISGSSNGLDPAMDICDSYRMAKLLYPELFADLDVEAEGDAIYKEFYGVDGLYTAMLAKFGVFDRWD